MIPDDPVIRFRKREDARISNAEIRRGRISNAPELFNADATERLRAKLKHLKKRLYEVKPPPDFRPFGYEW